MPYPILKNLVGKTANLHFCSHKFLILGYDIKFTTKNISKGDLERAGNFMDKNQYKLYHENKNHTSEDFPYNTYLCSIPLDFKSVRPHWHDEVEIIVIKKGNGIVYVNLTKYTVKSGDVIFVFPEQLHSIEQLDDNTMEYENILFKKGLLKSTGHDLCANNFIMPLFSGIISFKPIVDESCSFHAQLLSQIENIDSLCSTKPYGYQLAIKGYLFQILFLMISNTDSDFNIDFNQKSLDKIKMILTYISEHYHEMITIDDVANYCLYSKSYFMKFFKEALGTSFISYLNDYRLEIAAKELLASQDNILDIAIRTGFDNLSYFNRSFKRKYGITPGKYRKSGG